MSLPQFVCRFIHGWTGCCILFSSFNSGQLTVLFSNQVGKEDSGHWTSSLCPWRPIRWLPRGKSRRKSGVGAPPYPQPHELGLAFVLWPSLLSVHQTQFKKTGILDSLLFPHCSGPILPRRQGEASSHWLHLCVLPGVCITGWGSTMREGVQGLATNEQQTHSFSEGF